MAKAQLSSWYMLRKLGGLALRSLAKNVVSGAAAVTGVGTIVTAGMACWTLTDFVNTATELAEKLGPLAMEHLDDLLNVNKLQEMAKARLAEYRQNPAKFMADGMTSKAATDRCLRARKCMLGPFNQIGARRAAKGGEGCCPGQTGHHILPGAMSEGQTWYVGKHRSAPTSCLEGANKSYGSHGAVHRALKAAVDTHKKSAGPTMSYSQARDAGVKEIAQPKPIAPAAGWQRSVLREATGRFL